MMWKTLSEIHTVLARVAADVSDESTLSKKRIRRDAVGMSIKFARNVASSRINAKPEPLSSTSSVVSVGTVGSVSLQVSIYGSHVASLA